MRLRRSTPTTAPSPAIDGAHCRVRDLSRLRGADPHVARSRTCPWATRRRSEPTDTVYVSGVGDDGRNGRRGRRHRRRHAAAPSRRTVHRRPGALRLSPPDAAHAHALRAQSRRRATAPGSDLRSSTSATATPATSAAAARRRRLRHHGQLSPGAVALDPASPTPSTTADTGPNGDRLDHRRHTPATRSARAAARAPGVRCRSDSGRTTWCSTRSRAPCSPSPAGTRRFR